MLVAGGVGFIGSHLVNFLKDKGYWVRSVDIQPKKSCYLHTKEDEFLQLDLRHYADAEIATKDVEWVFNLSADMGGIGYIMEYNAPVMKNNVLINVNMLEASRHANIKRYFFPSSACIYPRELQVTPNLTPLKESDAIPAHPDSAYGWEKLFTEILCKNYEEDYGLPVRVGRFHNIYGPNCTYKGGKEKAPAALCRKVAEAPDNSTITIWGDGKQTRSFTYITDCLEAVYLLIQSEFSNPINIGVNDLITIDDLAQMVIRISSKKLSMVHDLSKPQGVRGRNADSTLIKSVLGWEPKVTLEQGMERLYQWVASEKALLRF